MISVALLLAEIDDAEKASDYQRLDAAIFKYWEVTSRERKTL